MSAKRKNPTKADAAKAPSLPTTINIADSRATTIGPTLLHFTAEQWKAVLKGGKRVERMSPKQVSMVVVPMPGGMNLAMPPPCPLADLKAIRL